MDNIRDLQKNYRRSTPRAFEVCAYLIRAPGPLGDPGYEFCENQAPLVNGYPCPMFYRPEGWAPTGAEVLLSRILTRINICVFQYQVVTSINHKLYGDMI